MKIIMKWKYENIINDNNDNNNDININENNNDNEMCKIMK